MTAAPKTQPEKGTAVAKIDPKLAVIKSRLERQMPSFAEVLPDYLPPERMVKLALVAINRHPELLACTAESIAEAVMDISAWGLEIGRTAHLVAFGNQCTALPDYKGKVELAIRGKSITSCRARIVYEHDLFEVEYGLVERLTHRPAWQENRGKPIGVYAIVVLPNGEPKFELMSADEVTKVQARSKAKDKGPWRSDPEEMWKKTVVHRLLKMVPQNPLLAAATEAEERADEDGVVQVSRLSRGGVRSGGYDGESGTASGSEAFTAGKPMATTVVNDVASRKPKGPMPPDPYVRGEEQEPTEEELRQEEREWVESEGRGQV